MVTIITMYCVLFYFLYHNFKLAILNPYRFFEEITISDRVKYIKKIELISFCKSIVFIVLFSLAILSTNDSIKQSLFIICINLIIFSQVLHPITSSYSEVNFLLLIKEKKIDSLLEKILQRLKLDWRDFLFRIISRSLSYGLPMLIFFYFSDLGFLILGACIYNLIIIGKYGVGYTFSYYWKDVFKKNYRMGLLSFPIVYAFVFAYILPLVSFEVYDVKLFISTSLISILIEALLEI